MGRRRYSENEEDISQQSGNSEAFSISSGLESVSREQLRKKYKKSHKHKIRDVEYSGDEVVYFERKKHKHKHKRHKEDANTHIHRHRSEHSEVSESYKHHKRRRRHRSSTSEIRNKYRKHSSEVEGKSRHSSRRRREKYYSDYPNSRDIKQEVDAEDISDDNDYGNEPPRLRPIKTEPITDTSSEEDNINQERREEERERNENWQDAEPKKEIKEEKPKDEKDTVNFGLSGKLTEDTNTYNGIVIKYSQPPEARKPKRRWRWYIFKGEEELPFLPLHRQSAYLIGRERKIADIPTDHPSCSKQHAVFQYRLVSYDREDGSVGRTVKPYILDLESANGTYVNNRRIDPKRYVELMERDVVKFGYSSREYVLLHEASKGSEDEAPDVGADQSPISLLRSQ